MPTGVVALPPTKMPYWRAGFVVDVPLIVPLNTVLPAPPMSRLRVAVPVLRRSNVPDTRTVAFVPTSRTLSMLPLSIPFATASVAGPVPDVPIRKIWPRSRKPVEYVPDVPMSNAAELALLLLCSVLLTSTEGFCTRSVPAWMLVIPP